MKILACILLLGFILVFWYLVNVLYKPVLNRMKNYYEEDPVGKSTANFLIGLMLIAAALIGHMIN